MTPGKSLPFWAQPPHTGRVWLRAHGGHAHARAQADTAAADRGPALGWAFWCWEVAVLGAVGHSRSSRRHSVYLYCRVHRTRPFLLRGLISSESFNWAGQQQFTPFDSWEYEAQTGNGCRAPEGKSWPWDPGMQFPDWCSALSRCHLLQPWPSLSHGLLTRGNEGGGDQLLQGVIQLPQGCQPRSFRDIDHLPWVLTQFLWNIVPASLGV